MGLLHVLKLLPLSDPQCPWLFTWDNFSWYPGLSLSESWCLLTVYTLGPDPLLLSGGLEDAQHLEDATFPALSQAWWLSSFSVLFQSFKRNQDPRPEARPSPPTLMKEFYLTVVPCICSYLKIHSSPHLRGRVLIITRYFDSPSNYSISLAGYRWISSADSVSQLWLISLLHKTYTHTHTHTHFWEP